MQSLAQIIEVLFGYMTSIVQNVHIHTTLHLLFSVRLFFPHCCINQMKYNNELRNNEDYNV